MKITFLMPADDLTGGNRVVAIYARELQARGHQVLVISNAPDRPTLRERLRRLRNGDWSALRNTCGQIAAPGHIALSGVPHHTLNRPRPFQASDVPDGDVVVATWWETARWMHQLPASKGRRVHLIQGYETWFGPQIIRQVQDTLRLDNCKIAISHGLRRDIQADLGPLPMHVVPNAVDLEQFNAPPRQRRHPPKIGFIYSKTPFKAADRYARAIELARRQVPELQVLAFGTDTIDPSLPLPPKTEYVLRPDQKDLAGLYAQCDAWLFASRIDSFGLPILESMACRTPVIGVSVGAAPELLADGHGWLVDTGEFTANNAPGELKPDTQEELLITNMARAIVQVCCMSDSDWQTISARVHTRAHAYSWKQATDGLLSILKNS